MFIDSPKKPRQQERWKVDFTEEDDELVCNEDGNDPIVVIAIIVNFKVRRILVDSGNAVEVLTYEAFQKIGLKKNALKKASPLYNFANHPVEVKGSITLPVTLGDDKHTTTEHVQFFVVDYAMAYNVNFERPTMKMTRMVVASFCMKIKFPTKTAVGYMQSDQRVVR